MKIIEPGTKIKYNYLGKIHKGVVHGARTYEDSDGTITGITYLIETDEVIREAADFNEDVPEGIDVTHTLEQREQIEIPQDFVSLA